MKPSSNEARSEWYSFGEKKEIEFVNIIQPWAGLSAWRFSINPRKRYVKWALDIVDKLGHEYDLKYQNRPFFKAGVLFGIHPQFAFAFNEKDYIRYQEEAPNCRIIAWLEWPASVLEDSLEFGQELIYPMRGVWILEFKEIAFSIKSGGAPRHEYKNRINDKIGNAKSSFILDLRTLAWVKKEIRFL
jgi:hypothetical protein